MTTIDPAALQSTLQRMFPSATIDDRVTARVGAALAAGASSGPAPGPADDLSYYLIQAEHARTRGTRSTFVGQLPVVRYSLPLQGDFSANRVPTVRTAIGYIIPEDRLIASVEMMPLLTGQTPARIDLLTPPRAPDATGARFAALATYLCYADADDPGPSSYVLEAGTVTGKPQKLFASSDMGPIVNQRADYQPTPFSKTTNFYSGALTMSADDPGEPATLHFTSTDTSGVGPATGQTPYITVSLGYGKKAAPPPYDPVGLILQAAARVGVIAGTGGMDLDPGWTVELARLFLGWNLEWIQKPGS